jgi:hypothetical protein|tara:strand:+ start:619 stop:1500 length:882 start_codon:yes stop_codon:yes gene_type:complete
LKANSQFDSSYSAFGNEKLQIGANFRYYRLKADDFLDNMTDTTNTPANSAPTNKAPKQGGFIGNLLFNIIIPTLILSKLSGEAHFSLDTNLQLGPTWSIIVALAFPIGYGLWDLKSSGKINAFSILGIVSVFLTGGMTLLQLDPKYIAIKEAAVPAIIGIAVMVSQRTGYPLVKTIILNEQVFKIEKLYAALHARQNSDVFERRLNQASYIVASSFFVSSVLNYALAKFLLVSEPGTEAFNAELGKMTAWSYPVIVVPSMAILLIAIWYLFSQIKQLTGESFEAYMVAGEKAE